MGFERLEAVGVPSDVVGVVSLLGHDHVEHGIEQGNIGAQRKAHRAMGITPQRLTARIEADDPGAALGRLLEVGGSDRVIGLGVAADQHHQISLKRLHEGRGDRARADALDQRRNRAGMAQPRTVVDMVGAKAGAHQLLKQPRFFVGAFGATETGKCVRPVGVTQSHQAMGGKIERFVPTGFAEVGQRIGGVEVRVHALRHAFAADEGACQSCRVIRVVETEAALHTQTAGV